jgi:hypothetical protein
MKSSKNDLTSTISSQWLRMIYFLAKKSQADYSLSISSSNYEKLIPVI